MDQVSMVVIFKKYGKNMKELYEDYYTIMSKLNLSFWDVEKLSFLQRKTLIKTIKQYETKTT